MSGSAGPVGAGRFWPRPPGARAGSPLRLLARPAAGFLPWLPAALGVAYLVVLLARLPGLVTRVYWDSDAAMITVAAETFGRGSVAYLAHLGWFTSLWFLLATRALPYHRELWEAAPLVAAFVGVGAVAWGVLRLAGRWAAATSAAIGVAVPPFVTYARIGWDFHAPAYIASALVAAGVLWLAGEPGRGRALAAGTALALIAGVSAASDGLFIVTGLIPLGASGLALLLARRRTAGLVAIAATLVALPLSSATTALMRHEGVTVNPAAPTQLASVGQLWPNFERLVGLVVQVGNGPYEFVGWQTPTATPVGILSVLGSALVLAALAAPFVALRRVLRTRPPSAPALAWCSFWAVAIVANCAGYEFTQIGLRWGYYLVPILGALAATLPLALAPSARRRALGGAAVAAVLLTSLVNLAGSTGSFGGLPKLASLTGRIVAIARAEHAPYGYTTGYYDSHSLTWASRLAVQMRTIQFCAPSVLCPLAFNALSSWFQPHATRSFVLEDSTYDYVDVSASSQFGAPIASFRLDSEYTMEIYPYDVASRLDDSYAPWALSLGYGSGFNAPESYQGQTSRWMIQDGQLELDSGVRSQVTLSTFAFSNGEPRLLELLDTRGRVLARRLIPTSQTAIEFGPLTLPIGSSLLRLEAIPGPETLGPSDPRRASVFLGPLTVEGGPTTTP